MTGGQTIAAVVGVVVVLTVLAPGALWWLDRRPRERILLVAATVVWGAATAALTASMSSFEPPTAALALLAAVPLAFKALGERGFDCPADGLVFGHLVAGGWTLGWLAVALPAASGNAPGQTVVGSDALAWVVTWLVVGASLGSTSLWSGRLARACAALVAVALGTAVRLVWSSSGEELVMAHGGPAVPVLLGLTTLVAVLLVGATLGIERRVLATELGEEVELGVLPAWAAEVFPAYWRRVRGNWWPVTAERTVISRLVSCLAMRKHALRRRQGTGRDLEWLEVVQLRNRLGKMIRPVSDDGDDDRETPALA